MDRKPFYDYYDFLGLEFTATQNQIYDAWRELKAHYSTSNPESLKYFSIEELRSLSELVDESYGVLSHNLKRSAYNEVLMRRLPEKYKGPTIYRQVSEDTRQIVHSQDQIDGASLQKVRESINCSVEELSQITKIKTEYLVALEQDDFNKLPAAVFVRGYISQISKVFGLDEASTCQSYMNFFNEKRV